MSPSKEMSQDCFDSTMGSTRGRLKDFRTTDGGRTSSRVSKVRFQTMARGSRDMYHSIHANHKIYWLKHRLLIWDNCQGVLFMGWVLLHLFFLMILMVLNMKHLD